MSWSSIANNQTVSFNNLQDAVNTGVFTLKNIIPVPNNEQVTSGEAEYFVDIIPTGKSANQLVVKSNLVAQTTTTTTTTTIACYSYEICADDGTGDRGSYPYTYVNCGGDPQSGSIVNLDCREICAERDSVGSSSEFVSIIELGLCTTTTTTTIFPQTNNLRFGSVSVSRDDVTSSNDGKYVAAICLTNNKLYISNDYGLNYTTVTVAGTNTLYRVDVSGTGEYMYCLSQAQGQPAVISRSTDYGVTWNITGGITNAFYSITTNRTGQYVLIAAFNLQEALPNQEDAGKPQVWRSSNYGVSFTRVDFSNSNDEQLATDVAISSSGDRQYAVSANFNLGGLNAYIGKGTVPLTPSLTPVSSGVSPETYYAVSTSADGSKIVVANQGGYYSYPEGAFNIRLLQSSNFGNSYVYFGGVTAKWYDVTIDGSGTNIIALSTGTNTLYRSVSFGTLSAVGSSRSWIGVSISYNAAVAIASETTGLWRSTNGGSTWTKLP